MRISVSNIGPVRSASIEVRPLTIFVGPNNAGKSLVATVMYAALSTNATTQSPLRLARESLNAKILPEKALQRAHISLLEMALYKGSRTAYEELPADVRTVIEDGISRTLDAYAAAVVEELERTAGAPIRSLRRVQKRPTRGTMRVDSSTPGWSVLVSIDSKGGKCQVEGPEPAEIWQVMQRSGWRRIRRNRRYLEYPAQPTQLARDLMYEIGRACFLELPPHTRYLPAARSGLMQSHKVLAGSLIRRSSLAGIEDLQIPAMSGVVTDFLSEMIELDPAIEGPFAGDGRELEKSILHGAIQVKDGVSGYPELIYETETGEFPLTRTSSMVSELAPIAVYLRLILRPEDLLFIEEPEAHLHPATQVLLAQFLVRLVNRGLQVGITTHSEFFLQQLNNSIVAGNLTASEIRSAEFDSELRIKPSLVIAYMFSPSAQGTIVSELPMTSREGISDNGFGIVAEMLYNQTVKLDRQRDAES